MFASKFSWVLVNKSILVGIILRIIGGFEKKSLTAGVGFFVFRSFNLVKIVTPCSISFGFLAGPWWDSENRKNFQKE